MAEHALLVDTNLLVRPSLRDLLTAKINAGLVQAYVPTLIHAERIRQIVEERGENFALHIIQQLVAASGFELLPLSVEDAEAIAEVWLDLKKRETRSDKEWQTYWRQNRFDILLCAIARSRGYTLVTDDKGVHFDVVTRLNTADLQTWLAKL